MNMKTNLLKNLGCLLLLFGATAINAQNYTIDWFTIDGGGGTSTGGVYTVQGTIGQPDAGILTGGNYSLQGGFWGLVAAVREGRKREVGAHYSESDFADPQAATTFEQCKLDWSKPARSPHAGFLRLHRDLISLRKQHSSLGNCRKDLTVVRFDEQARWFVMRRADTSGSRALVVCNVSAAAQSIPVAAEAQGCRLALWTGDATYGSNSTSRPAEMLTAGSNSAVLLSAFEAAIYLS